MKKFICKIILLAVVFVVTNVVLLFAIPKDKNAYLCEYNKKIHLLETTQEPRMIFIGGSSIAFGTDSKLVSDSLHYHVINFGLHGGIGIRYPMEDALQYIRKGDVVVLQFEYGNFFAGGNGNRETFASLMISTNWRNTQILNAEQWMNIITGIPRASVKGVIRLLKYLKYRNLDTPKTGPKHIPAASGFNKYGDEVNHFNYPSKKYVATGKKQQDKEKVDIEFMDWLADAIKQYEQAGAKVVLLPPVCIKSHFIHAYNDNIEKALEAIHNPYIVSPSSMVLDDNYTFDTGYHVNREGCNQNTQNIIRSLYYLKNVEGGNVLSAK